MRRENEWFSSHFSERVAAVSLAGIQPIQRITACARLYVVYAVLCTSYATWIVDIAVNLLAMMYVYT
jgi:hypothetical protein